MRQEEFSLMCPTPNKRPRHVTDAMASQVALETAADLVKWHDFDAGTESEIAGDILSATRWNRTGMDGYEIARELDQRRQWTCNSNIVEVLDGFSSRCAFLLHDAEKRWGIENPMEPPLPVGSVVRAHKGLGVIESIYDHMPAYYCVKVTRLPNGHELIRFEDAVLVEYVA